MSFLATGLLGLCLVAAAITDLTSRKQRCRTLSFKLDWPKNRMNEAGASGSAPVTFTMFKGRAARGTKQPVVFLLNGFNVESEWYSQLCERLCNKGLTIVTVEDKRILPYVVPGLPRPGCSVNYTYISGGYLSLIYQANTSDVRMAPVARSAAALFQELARHNGVMLLGHSQGGHFGADIMNGTCDGPSSRNTSSCDGYAPMLDSKGDDLIKAAVMYEGYSAGMYGIQLKPNRVMAYAAGSFNVATEQAYVNTTGCKIFARLKHANHYGLTNYVPSINGSQVTPCARPAISDPAEYQVTKSIQVGNVVLVSDLALAVARAFRGGELNRDGLKVTALQSRLDDLKMSCEP